ncbi:unnamed protein product, partial [marine sediment metagenome]
MIVENKNKKYLRIKIIVIKADRIIRLDKKVRFFYECKRFVNKIFD